MINTETHTKSSNENINMLSLQSSILVLTL